METQDRKGNQEGVAALSMGEEAAIKVVAQRIGLRISEEIVVALSQTALLVRQGQREPGALPASDASPGVLTVPEVAERLRLSKAKTYQLIQRQELRAISFDRTVRVRLEEL